MFETTPASPAQSSSIAFVNPDPETEMLKLAQKAVAEGVEPRHEPRAVVRSVKVIVSLRALDEDGLAALGENERRFAVQVRSDFAAAGIDADFLAPGQAIATRFEALLDGSPSDRRKIGSISLEDRDTTIKTARRVSRAKNAVAAAARHRFQMEAAEAFGRGSSFNHDSPVDVHEALGQFLDGAKKYPELVATTGITADELAEFETARKDMDAILQRKQLREGGKASGTDALKFEQLALESWLDLFRSRVTWRLEDDAARERVLGLLPRATERRKRGAAKPLTNGAAKPAAAAATAPPVQSARN